MPAPQNVIALIFDFDDTLTDDSVTALLERKGVSVDQFWEKDVASLVKNGWDPPLAYMRRMLDLSEPGGPLEGLTNSELTAFGRQLKPYPGLPSFLKHVRVFIQSKDEYRKAGITVQFFIVSGGLQEIIEGFTLRSLFTDIWASSFATDPQTSVIKFPRNAITFTDKTRFLFEINKGLIGPEFRANPDAVNRKMDEQDRPVPFRNMIYVGDGLTDVPCFSLVGGIAAIKATLSESGTQPSPIRKGERR